MPQKKDETDGEYQQRSNSIREARKKVVPSEFIWHRSATNDQKRREITNQLHEFIAKELYLNIVKQVTIYTSKLPGNGRRILVIKN